ncbi:MAG: patatin-like phospholipase family protein [Planctomycetes bacterium]|nr:patatin-like phospholipase family protein [Planctomycetota bacterium]
MADEIVPLLKLHEYFHHVSEEALHEVAAAAQVSQFPAGVVIHEPDSHVNSIGFVLRGRLKALRIDIKGNESLFRMIERGEQFGMMVGALAEPVPVRVVTLEPSTVLYLDYERAMELTLKHADLRRHWLQTFARVMRRHFLGPTPTRAANVMAILHESPATRTLARKLILRLREVGEEIGVFSDSDEWRSVPDLKYRSMLENGTPLELAEIRRQVDDWHGANRIVFDLPTTVDRDRAVRLLELADHVIVFARAADCGSLVPRLRDLGVQVRGWRDKIRVVWLLENGNTVAPVVPELRDYAIRDFKVSEMELPARWGKLLSRGLERLVHDLRGVRIGVALGGGAARGMSHLGVLKAIEQSGIVVDMIAGTSAGAMSGIVYSSGLDCDFSAKSFSTDLTPSWLFRRLPQGKHWYLLYKFRRGHFDPMLREYLHDWKLEQLPLPCLSVTTDLVSGKAIVRDRGDAVHAILESINLPVLSVPIVREGRALIDGGLVNNIPADVLVSMGCNFVIAVSVTAKMEMQFCEIKPGGTTPRKRPPVLQTLLRSLLVQNYNLNAIGVQPADVVIEPDVTGFDLTEFMRAKELAAVGEQAALSQIPKIKSLLARLDPGMFPFATSQQ